MTTVGYITPVMPSATGGGREIRAYCHLRDLAATECKIVLICQDSTRACKTVAALVTEIIQPREKSLGAKLWARLLKRRADVSADQLDSALQQCDSYHVFRLATLDWIKPTLGNKPLHLDLDELDSVTYQSMAEVALLNGNHQLKTGLDTAATAYKALEDRLLSTTDHIIVSSPVDLALVKTRYAKARVQLQPNRYIATTNHALQPCISKQASVLFVGTLGYYPNIDALNYFIDDILPIINERYSGHVILRVAGRGAPRHLKRKLARNKQVSFAGFVDDLTPLYHQSSAVICPIRAGGGTRIKIIEAIAHNRPVVTTPMGMQGLPIDKDSILIANSALDFAKQVICLLQDKPLANQICINANAALRNKGLIIDA